MSFLLSDILLEHGTSGAFRPFFTGRTELLLADQLLCHGLGTPFRAGSFSASWAVWPLADGKFVPFQTLDILLQF